MSRVSIFLLLGAAVAVAAAVAGCQATRAGYETAPYKVVGRDGPVEFRSYPALRVAETPTGGDDFMRLFRYISRDNKADQKIAMTTPVFMATDEKSERSMAFVLPETLTTPPAPKNDRVTVREVPGGTFAVIRFHGRRQTAEGEASTRLRAWLTSRNLTPLEAPRFAYFDPPWTPGFLRRNEVMVRIPATAIPKAGS
jgi:DNA gyrase inhibitor GyrI